MIDKSVKIVPGMKYRNKASGNVMTVDRIDGGVVYATDPGRGGTVEGFFVCNELIDPPAPSEPARQDRVPDGYKLACGWKWRPEGYPGRCTREATGGSNCGEFAPVDHPLRARCVEHAKQDGALVIDDAKQPERKVERRLTDGWQRVSDDDRGGPAMTKDEFDREIDACRENAQRFPDAVGFTDRVIMRLADENDRLLTDLREEVESNVELRAKLDGVRDENDRLLTDLREEVESNVELRAKLDGVRDENDRLRKQLEDQPRPMPWTDDEIKAIIKEAIESDPNAKCIHCGGTFPKTEMNHWRDCPKHTARIENDRLRAELAKSDERCAKLECEAAGLASANENLRAERAEVVALLEDATGYQSLDYCDDDPDDLGEGCADVYDDNA